VKTSLGLLEVKGLALAINAADAMAKSAAVNIIEIENTRGSGWMLIKITGDVASVQAAISTGSQLAEQNNGLVSQKVLSRPDEKLLRAVLNQAKTAVVKPKLKETEIISAVEEEVDNLHVAEEIVEEIDEVDEVTAETKTISDVPVIVTCNLCQDPLCSRIKGEPHSDCINGGKNK
jgi:microcompartment protein CcmL/EutN